MHTVRHTICGAAILWYTDRTAADRAAALDVSLWVRPDIAAGVGDLYWTEPWQRPMGYVHPYDQERLDMLAGRSEEDHVREHLATCR